MIDDRTLYSTISEYLSNDYLNIIFFASNRMIEEAKENEEYRNMLERVDLILSEDRNFLPDFLPGKKLYLLGDNEAKLKNFIAWCEEKFRGITILGAYCVNPELGPELIINEINGLSPDIILAVMDSPVQEIWITNNCTKLDARLCIGLGSIVDSIMGRKGRIRSFLRRLRMDHILSGGHEKK